jgi:hypothetical protein
VEWTGRGLTGRWLASGWFLVGLHHWQGKSRLWRKSGHLAGKSRLVLKTKKPGRWFGRARKFLISVKLVVPEIQLAQPNKIL